MLRNYFKIAFRNLFKEKLFSVINIVGLSVGTAVAILMILFVREEWSYDQFHTKSDRIYRAWVKEHYQGELFFNTVTPFILGRELQENFPEIEEVTRYLTINSLVKEDNFSDQESIHFATPTFLSTFDFNLLEGNEESALDGLEQVVLTPEMAKKYFGNRKPMGKPLSIQIGGEWQEFQVAGIVEEAPAHSSIQYNILIPFDNIKKIISERGRSSWTSVFPETYTLLREGVSPKILEAKMAPFINEKVEKLYKAGEYIVGLQPLADIHLNNEIPAGIVPVSDWRYPYIMSAIAILILVLAGINFVTLAVGRSVSRAKEVGIRKVTGATRFQVMQQFWSEALILTTIAVGGGLLLAELCLPFFNDLSNKQLVLEYNVQNISTLILFGIGLGLVAGIYPALVISGFSPLKAIRGVVSKLGAEKHLVLRGLIGFQFVLSVVLIISTIIMQRQMSFLQNQNLGYDQDQMLILPYNARPTANLRFSDIYKEGLQKAELLEYELAAKTEVKGLTVSSHTFGTPGWLQLGFTDPASQKFRNFYMLTIDYDYLDVMGIELIDGRNFSKDVGTDAMQGIILNEAMAKEYGMEDRVGQQMPKPFEQFQLVGISKNFNYNSLHTVIEPLAMVLDPIQIRRACSDANYGDFPSPKLTIKLEGGTIPTAMSMIRSSWKKVAPEQPFNFTFMNEAIDNQYRAESRLSKILTSATILGIFIACLGLFGMATLTIARRTKEIGVRKILGASVIDIIFMLNKRFTWMILVASIIATPIAYFLMKGWLEDFAYHISIKPFVFILATLLVLLVAWLAVSFHSIRAALSNPVKALRYE